MPLTVQGKHFHLNGKPHFLRTVTYGPFPPDSDHRPDSDFPKIRAAGFDSLRIYALPAPDFLDAAHRHQLSVIPSHPWASGCDFLRESPHLFLQAQRDLVAWLSENGTHPALAALLVGNEIPSEMARWMGPWKVTQALDSLVLAAKKAAPHLPIGYANFPTTEYLEPPSADFTAFNLYLEDPEALKKYLPRLHHLAGNRPVYLTEFGLDTQSHPESAQAALLTQALTLSHAAGLAGATIYAWSDQWFNNQKTITAWSFGLVRRDGSAKPALAALRDLTLDLPVPLPATPPRFSVIVCTRNGADRITRCLEACQKITYPDFEIIAVNDGSTDDTAAILDQLALTTSIRVAHLPPSGLSAARNHGASLATGSILAFTDDDCEPDPLWLSWLAFSYSQTDHAAIGGPNLSPPPPTLALALTTAAPGAPTHVMLDDLAAEHLPGCHLSVKKSAFDQIGGFDPVFHTAGDDVDFCWRLRDAGFTLGFSPASFVWHHRRATPWRYLKQQIGYGKAEGLLYRKHAHRFTPTGIRWEGFVYHGSPLSFQKGDFIYTGPTGEAPYQSLSPLSRPLSSFLPTPFNRPGPRILLRILARLQSFLRRRARKQFGAPAGHTSWPQPLTSPPRRVFFTLIHPENLRRHDLYQHLRQHGWEACPHPDYDLMRLDAMLLAATEQTGTPHDRTFVALTRPVPDFDKLLTSAGFQFISPPDANP